MTTNPEPAEPENSGGAEPSTAGTAADVHPTVVTLNPPLRTMHRKLGGMELAIFYLSTMACVADGWGFYYLCIAQPWMLVRLKDLIEKYGLSGARMVVFRSKNW